MVRRSVGWPCGNWSVGNGLVCNARNSMAIDGILSVGGGINPGSVLANMDFPDPGGPIINML